MTTETLRYTRVFDAPRELVFRCMIEPEHLTHFWGPAGTSAPLDRITVDPRPGGAFRTVMVNDADGSSYPTSAVYLEVTPPERLSWAEDHSGMVVTATFTELAGTRTQVEIEQVNVPPQMLDPRAQAGFLTSLDRFAAHLALLTGANPMTATAELPAAIAAERRALGDVLHGLSESEWNADSLCAGWRIRDVVAHITMPFRYPARRFLAEMARSGGNFARMADRCARRDGQEPTPVLLEGLRRNEHNPWQPPGGGLVGALTHDVVHGLDITIPLGVGSLVPEQVLRVVLDSASSPRSRKHFGVDLTGVRLRADDLDWAFGDGQLLHAQAHHLLMVLCGRRLPTGLLHGPAAPLVITA